MSCFFGHFAVGQAKSQRLGEQGVGIVDVISYGRHGRLESIDLISCTKTGKH